MSEPLRGCLNFATEEISASGRGIFTTAEGGVGVPTAREAGVKSTRPETESARGANFKQPLISIRGLSVAYDGRPALSCDRLDINKHDFIGVTGPNGGGKTTLVKAIMGSIPYKGEIIRSPEAADGTGYLPQVNSADRTFPIPVREAVLSGLQSKKGILKRYTRQDRARVEELLELTGVKHLSDRTVAELSGGEFQRVMLCRAIISDPALLILDEPANFVDNKFEGELYALLRELNGSMAILMVSHDMEAVSPYIKSSLYVDRTVRNL